MSFDEEYLDDHHYCAAEIKRLEATNANLLAACDEVLDWYERDGSVGGAVEPMAQLAAAIRKAKGE